MSFLLYFIVGGVSFLANFAAFAIAVELLGLDWVLGNIVGFIVGTLLNYVLSANFVFESKIFAKKKTEILLVFFVSAVGLAIETFMIHVAYDLLQFQLYVAKIVGAVVAFFWNYEARRVLVFGELRRLRWP